MSEKILRWIDAHLLVLLGAVFVLRAGFLLITGLDLVGDESYYWDWSRQPDWCYYSKPPMVAWLIGAFTWLLGDYAATVRLPAVVLGTVFLWFFHATAQAFYGRRAAAFALLMILATPIDVLANFIMTIDPPLYCFWMISLYYLRRALFDQDSRAWLWAGCASAAALLSKQVAVALPVMLLVFILLDRRRYAWLKREFLIYLLPIAVAAIPILLWNQQHDWVMFGHSKGHFGSHEPWTLSAGLKHARELFFYQLLLLSPLIFGLVLIVSLQAVAGFKGLRPDRQFLVLTGPAMLLAVLLLSFAQKVQGNWPMPFYFSALILLSGFWQEGRWKKSLKYGLVIGYLMVSITYLLPVLLQAFNWQNTAIDPTKRFKHWQELAENIHIERQIALPSLDNTFVVALGHRYLASQLAFYLPDHPKVFRFETGGTVMSQYEVWPGPVEFTGRNAIIVSDGADNVPEPVQAAFERFSFLVEMPNPMQPGASYYLYLGEKLKAWPSPVRQTVSKESS